MKSNIDQALRNELYIPFVESLYSNRMVIAFGAAVQALIAYAIYESTGLASLLYFAVLFPAVAMLRLGDALLFDRAKILGDCDNFARYWETRYLFGVSLASLLIGAMTYIAIMSGDSFSEFASMTLAMATMVTIVGKNFASARIVHAVTLFVFAPTVVSLLLMGGWKHYAAAFLLLPFSYLVSSMSRYVRNFLHEAVRGKLEISAIANHFDVAINHMPQGLILFDAEGDALVVNAQAAQLMKINNPEMLVGRNFKTIIRYNQMRGLLHKKFASEAQAKLLDMRSQDDQRKFITQAVDGQHLEFSVKSTNTGGSVLLFEDITERVLVESNIHHMARFDALSGLSNRVYFKDLVKSHSAQVSDNSFVAFFVIDIDDFKHVNDSLGHLVGDDLLCRFADRIKLLMNDKNCFSRFGGDEFVGMLFGFETAEAAEFAARKALRTLSGHFDLAGRTLNVTVSSGIEVTTINQFDLSQSMIKADLALYESKAKGKGISTLFASAMDDTYQRRQRLKSDLKQAIASKELSVFYQPIIDANTMRISVCEALCRWDHPELGPISPAVFIPLAEETGAISDLSRYMLEQACADCVLWDEDVSVAVNLSAMDFRQSNIQEMVRLALAKSRLKPSRLEVEVTEGAILEDQVGASKILNDLKATGVRIALDDFGTGYSSLSYLHNLPLDKVKIDQSFIKDIVANERSLKLVAGVTRLAEELGLTVTIEGIETLEQFESLRENAHIDLAQGFLFGAALSSRGISTLIENVIPASKQGTRIVRSA